MKPKTEKSDWPDKIDFYASDESMMNPKTKKTKPRTWWVVVDDEDCCVGSSKSKVEATKMMKSQLFARRLFGCSAKCRVIKVQEVE